MIVRVVVGALVASVRCFHSVIDLFLISDSFLVLVVDLLIKSLRGFDVVPTRRENEKKNRKMNKNSSMIPKILVAMRKIQIILEHTCTLKNGPIIWTVVSSSAGAVPCSGSLIILPVTRCNSRTFWPPLPIIRPTCSEIMDHTLEM